MAARNGAPTDLGVSSRAVRVSSPLPEILDVFLRREGDSNTSGETDDLPTKEVGLVDHVALAKTKPDISSEAKPNAEERLAIVACLDAGDVLGAQALIAELAKRSA